LNEGRVMFGIFDVYLLEALVNGVLLGGVFALLALASTWSLASSTWCGSATPS
jgi:hypothetical protein